MQIQDLEASLGIALVERTRNGIKLTPKGEEIAIRAQRLLNDVRNLVDYAQHSGGVLSGTLRLGVIPSVAPYLLPPLLPLLKENYPDLELHVRETQTAPLTDELIEGKARRPASCLADPQSGYRDADRFRRPVPVGAPEDAKALGARAGNEGNGRTRPLASSRRGALPPRSGG